MDDGIPRNKYGFPIKKPTKIAHHAQGGPVGEKSLYQQDKERLDRKNAGVKDVEGPSIADSIDTALKNYKDKVVNAVTPQLIKNYRDSADKDMDRDNATRNVDNTDTTADVTTKRKGGRIKSKPRGVGLAARGHGKAMGRK